MDMERSESRYEQREGRDDRDDSPVRGKDRKKSSRGGENDHRSKERERSRRSGGDDISRERRKDDRDDREKDRSRDIKDRVKERDREKERDAGKDGERGRDKERGKEKNKDRDKEREREREREHEKEKERDKARDKERDREREKEKQKEKDKGKERSKEKEREADQDKEKSRNRSSRKNVEEDYDWSKDDDKSKVDGDNKPVEVPQHFESEQTAEGSRNNKAGLTTTELENRILKMKDERTKKTFEDGSGMLSWVNKIRKIEKEKALQMSKLLEEQDNIIQEESDDEEIEQQHNLAGVKVLHGIDKVMEGGAVVLTLKDQSILADGDVNEETDALENVEIGEQKRRDDAYKAAKKKAGTYGDKFNDDPFSEKKMLPQYDEPNTDEGITLDEKGRIAVEAEKRLEELRRRLNGASSNNRVEDLNVPGKVSSDYLTPEEMLRFKKPKKKKALRKKDKLDIDALEAEALSAGLGVGDLGSRSDAKRQAIKEEQDRAEAERRDKAYQAAYAKADEASKSLRLEQTLPVKPEQEEDVFADDDEDLYKSLERARKIALQKKEEEAPYGPEAIARLATTISSNQNADEQALESQGNMVVLSEMEEFVWSLQLGDESQKPDAEDVFMGEDEEPKASEEEVKDEPGGWTEVKDVEMEETPSNEQEEEVVPDEIIHEVAVGKGLSGALKLLQDRGALKETVEWGGRNMDKKKSKLVGILDDDGPKKTQQPRQKDSKDFAYQEKDIRIERTDEFGRILTPKEAFRIISHKFHGKGPGKMKQEKRMKQFQEELKLKQMKSSDTPSLSVERMREAQAQLKTPYLVLSGHVKPGQTSDPRSGYATVEKDLPGGLTPMLGDRKVEHFLGIKRKPEPSNLGPSKKSRP